VEEGENNGEGEPNRDRLFVYMEISPQNPLHNYYTLIKTLKKENSFTLTLHLKLYKFLGHQCFSFSPDPKRSKIKTFSYFSLAQL
jgi:hypothetical protein